MSKVIIAIGRHKNVGKDTFAMFLMDILRPVSRGKRIVRRGFADKLYHVLHLMYGWAGFQTLQYYQQNPAAKEIPLKNGKTPRQLLIEVGTPVLRAYDDDIHINACLKDEDYDILLVNDMRFPNEFKMVKSLGAVTVNIIRPGLVKPTDVADTGLDGWDDLWDETIYNDGDKQKLWKEAERIAEKYILKSNER